MLTMSSPNFLYKVGDSDNEREMLMDPCFVINSDIQLTDIPSTGEEYLLHVRKERRNYPVVTKCKQIISNYSSQQSVFVQELPPPKKAPESLIPTKEWQNCQIADFSDVRLCVTKMLKQFPNKIERRKINIKNSTDWQRFFEQESPTLSCILSLHPIDLEKGLEFLINNLHGFKEGKVCDKTGAWIYSILACIRQPLLSDTISLLRNLARQCAEIRSCLKSDGEEAEKVVAPLNLFICIVSRYFRQYDLAD